MEILLNKILPCSHSLSLSSQYLSIAMFSVWTAGAKEICFSSLTLEISSSRRLCFLSSSLSCSLSSSQAVLLTSSCLASSSEGNGFSLIRYLLFLLLSTFWTAQHSVVRRLSPSFWKNMRSRGLTCDLEVRPVRGWHCSNCKCFL